MSMRCVKPNSKNCILFSSIPVTSQDQLCEISPLRRRVARRGRAPGAGGEVLFSPAGTGSRSRGRGPVQPRVDGLQEPRERSSIVPCGPGREKSRVDGLQGGEVLFSHPLCSVDEAGLTGVNVP